MKKMAIVSIFAAVVGAVYVAIAPHRLPTPKLEISHWIAGSRDGAYVCQLYYGDSGAAISFASEKDFEAFVNLPYVKVIATPAPIRTARSEVVVESHELP